MTTDPNLKVQVDHDARTIDIRQSAIGAFVDCRNKFRWEYVEGLEPDYTSSQRPWKTTDIGSAFHAGIGAYYLEMDALAYADAYILEQGWELEDIKDRDLIHKMLLGHIDDIASQGLDIGERTIGVEVPVQGTVLDVNGYDVTVHGQVDRLIETEDGLQIIDDWKTVGPLDTALGHIQQLMRYALLIRSSTGWRADRIRTTQVRKVKRTGDGPFCARPWIPCTDEVYAHHAALTRHLLGDIVACLVDDGPWYEAPSGECSWKCRVEDICVGQQHGDDVEMIVELHYRKKGT